MYKKSFYIEEKVGNNIFSFDQRSIKKLFVPALIQPESFAQIELGDEIAFSDVDFDGNLIERAGLKNFYHILWRGKDLYLFDNHNHAFYFWYLARSQGKIGNQNLLIHIDEHSDMRDPGIFLSREESLDMRRVFECTNFELNVGNYIVPAMKEGIVESVMQIRNEYNLLDYIQNPPNKTEIIANVDLDFFEPGLDYIDYELKKKVVLDACEKAGVITVCTSPFFIDQKLALDVFFDIFQ